MSPISLRVFRCFYALLPTMVFADSCCDTALPFRTRPSAFPSGATFRYSRNFITAHEMGDPLSDFPLYSPPFFRLSPGQAWHGAYILTWLRFFRDSEVIGAVITPRRDFFRPSDRLDGSFAGYCFSFFGRYLADRRHCT